MGICLDTEQNDEELESSGQRTGAGSARRRTPPGGHFPMQNTTHVKFEPPQVPVIFVLGGPGSGKVTHCDNLMQERRGLVHINMTDLLQQYAIGNDMQDFGTLSSRTVTEVLMLEMKMAPTARAYLVSGYPRSMRDVAEYSEKIQTMSGAVLVSWRQRVLERQIEYGARLGHVVLGLARMELANFYRSVMPVADYFDQTNVLVAINGERNPEDVYKDFRAAVLQILGPLEDQTLNGVSAVGVGAGGIPGEIVGVEPAPTRPAVDPDPPGDDVDVEALEPEPPPPLAPHPAAPLPRAHRLTNGSVDKMISPKAEVIRVRGDKSSTTPPPTVWVVGGPGSNKAALCQLAAAQRPGWMHFSVGQRLRALADAGGVAASEGARARASVAAGEPAPAPLVARLVRAAAAQARAHAGLLLDGYPRDLAQAQLYEEEFQTQPRAVLLDCSKLQLGRGRRDDSVGAFRRRLEVFRELTLPLLRALDRDHRLVIVDGDTDSPEVQAEFTRVLQEEMDKAELIAAIPRSPAKNETTTEHVRTEGKALQQLANATARMGGALGNGAVLNGHAPGAGVGNGFIGLGSNKVKPLMKGVTRVATVSQLAHEDARRLYEQGSGEVAPTLNTHI